MKRQKTETRGERTEVRRQRSEARGEFRTDTGCRMQEHNGTRTQVRAAEQQSSGGLWLVARFLQSPVTSHHSLFAILTLSTIYYLLPAKLYADFKLSEVRPRIMTIGSSSMNDRIFFKFEPSEVYKLKLTVFSLDGISVREVSYNNDGSGRIFWEGKNNDGIFVLPGVYIYQLEAGKKVVNGAIVVAR